MVPTDFVSKPAFSMQMLWIFIWHLFALLVIYLVTFALHYIFATCIACECKKLATYSMMHVTQILLDQYSIHIFTFFLDSEHITRLALTPKELLLYWSKVLKSYGNPINGTAPHRNTGMWSPRTRLWHHNHGWHVSTSGVVKPFLFGSFILREHATQM